MAVVRVFCYVSARRALVYATVLKKNYGVFCHFRGSRGGGCASISLCRRGQRVLCEVQNTYDVEDSCAQHWSKTLARSPHEGQEARLRVQTCCTCRIHPWILARDNIRDFQVQLDLCSTLVYNVTTMTQCVSVRSPWFFVTLVCLDSFLLPFCCTCSTGDSAHMWHQ